MDTKEFLEMFLSESAEHLQEMNDQILNLEEDPENLSVVNDIFRAAHTLKGMSATMGYTDLSNLTHRMENVLDAIRNEKIKITPQILDVIFSSVDELEFMVKDIETGGEGKRDVNNLLKQLEVAEHGECPTKVSESRSVDASPQPNEEEVIEANDKEESNQEMSGEDSEKRIDITISRDADMKSVRAIMAMNALEKHGEIISTHPPQEQIEEGEFDQLFSVTFTSDTSNETIEKDVKDVFDVEQAAISNDQHTQPKERISSKNNDKTNEESKENADLVKTNTSPPHEIESNNNVSSPSVTKPKEVSEKTINPEKKKKDDKSVVNKSIRVNIDRLDNLMNLFEELVIDRGRLEQISADAKRSDLRETVEHMSRVSDDLQNIILNMRMVPIDNVFSRFRRMVRGLAKDLDKKVHLELEGEETELDRTVIDEIGDPLVHLLRNSIDHGLESPAVRKENGKDETGNILMKAYHSGNDVFIEVADDGAGINRDKVLEKAVSNGVVSEEKALSMPDDRVYELLFSSGLSTADQISDVSGRGVGLDVVKSSIEALGGTAQVHSEPGRGTRFTIQLPLTLSIMSAMLVKVQGETYSIPSSSIKKMSIIDPSDIKLAQNEEVINFQGGIVPLVKLSHFFSVPRQDEENPHMPTIIIQKGEKYSALIVDEFIGMQEIVLKSLGNYMSHVPSISGATILGNGEVSLIIDPNSLIE